MAEKSTKTQQQEIICSEIDKLLDQIIDTYQPPSIERLKKLCEEVKGNGIIARDYLAALLQNKDTPSRRRGWILSTLAEINQPDSVEIIALHLDSKAEKSDRVRMWAAVALAKLDPPDLEKRLEEAITDKSAQVQATALRLLVGRQIKDEHLEKLQALFTGDRFGARWAALRVLRDELGEPLPEPVEKKLMPSVINLLQDSEEWRDVRQQAALALGSMVHHKEAAIRALNSAIKSHPSSSIRRNCAIALVSLKDAQALETLLYVLNDESPQIRTIAVEGLKSQYKTKGAIELIINDLMKQRPVSDDMAPDGKVSNNKIPEEYQGYIEALRYLDDEQAAEVLSKNLLHPDPGVADFTAAALTALGGQTAIRTLQAQRATMLRTYTNILEQADQRIMGQFEAMMKQARLAFRLSLIMHSTIFVVGVIIMIAGLVVAVSTQDPKQIRLWVGLGGSAAGLGAVVSMFYRDPFKNIGHSVNNLVKVNVVFLGYVRQINQIDAIFKQVFFNTDSFNVEQMKETVAQIEATVKNTLDQVKAHLPE